MNKVDLNIKHYEIYTSEVRSITFRYLTVYVTN